MCACVYGLDIKENEKIIDSIYDKIEMLDHKGAIDIIKKSYLGPTSSLEQKSIVEKIGDLVKKVATELGPPMKTWVINKDHIKDLVYRDERIFKYISRWVYFRMVISSDGDKDIILNFQIEAPSNYEDILKVIPKEAWEKVAR
jgi:hypothetical protein